MSPHAGLALHEALADQVSGPLSACKLLVWRCTHALLVTPSETRLPRFNESAAQMRVTGWPVIVRKSGGGVCPVGPGTVQIATIDVVRPDATMSGKYDCLARLVQSALACFQIDCRIGPVAAAYCPGRYDLSVAGRKIAGISQRWFRNRQGVRCVIASASLNVEEPPEGLASVVNGFCANAGSAFRCKPTALTNMRLSGCQLANLTNAVMSSLATNGDVPGAAELQSGSRRA